MEVMWFILALLWLVVLPAGCFTCYRKGMNTKKLVIESLSFKQAMKWWAVHELIRHEDDKRQIRSDMRKLSNVKMPEGTEYDLWVDIYGDPKVKGEPKG